MSGAPQPGRLAVVARRLAFRAELAVERLMPRGNGPPVIEPYRGFATPQTLVVRARVLTALRRTEPDPEHSRWTNLRQMAGLFLTNEVADLPVAVPEAGVHGSSDGEGFVWLEVPRGEAAPGWRSVSVEIEGLPQSRTACPVLVPRPEAAFGVVSDVDDTLIVTGAHSLLRNLWTTFTGSALTRQVHADAVPLLEALCAGGRNPVFYVSSSPWNLHHFLERIFTAAGLPPGPMFLRDLGFGEGHLLGGHGAHKGGAIDAILDANPALPFVLVGDLGQKDAFAYHDAVLRHPGRIRAVILREAGGAPSADAWEAMTAIEAAGVELFHGPDYAAAIARFEAT